MKFKKIIMFGCLFLLQPLQAMDDNLTEEDISDVSPPPKGSPVETKVEAKKQVRTYTDAQLLQSWVDVNGNPIKKNDFNRHDIPIATQIGMMSIGGGFQLADLHKLFSTYPSASQFFPHNANLAGSFSALINDLKGEPLFFAYLKALYATVLQELYSHLKKVFATFNLTKVDEKNFLAYEQNYAYNTKALILMHLVNIVNSQSYKFSQSLFSRLPKSVAALAGNTLLRNDTSINLRLLIADDSEIDNLIEADETTKQNIHQKQKKIQRLFKSYFNFFKQYTGHIVQKPSIKTFKSENLLARELAAIRPLIKARKAQNLPIVPQFFFPTKGTIRAVRLIPELARRIPAATQRIGWPQQIITAATNGTPARNSLTNASLPFPVAYFKDVSGNETRSRSHGQKLCVNMPSGNRLFEQELLVEPDWLRQQEEIINIARACLGDFTALLGKRILTTETEALITQIMFT